jgi:DedD protein
MDQTLQARLIGATVLVALAVLLIPELLSGRKTVEPAVEEGAASRGTRTFTIELGGPRGPGASLPGAAPPAAVPMARAPTTLARDPVPVEAPSAGAATKAAPSGAVERAPPEDSGPREPSGPVAVEAAPQPQRAPGTAGSSGDWVVQVGAFGSADAARRLIAELAAAGYEAQVAPVTRAGRTLHRVRVGPASGRPAAQQLAAQLQARGMPAAVVAND